MKKALLLGLFPLLSLLTACDKDDLGLGVRGTGPVESEARSVNSFSRVEVKDHIDVIITQGAEQQVRVEAQNNILDIVETKVSGDQLELRVTRPIRGKDTKRIRAYLTVPALTEVAVADHAAVQSASTWSAGTFRLRVKDHGTADLRLSATEALVTSLKDHASVVLAGEARRHELSGQGHVSIRAFDLNTRATDVTVRDHASAQVLATETLSAEARDHASVTYRGRPTLTTRTDRHSSVSAAQ